MFKLLKKEEAYVVHRVVTLPERFLYRANKLPDIEKQVGYEPQEHYRLGRPFSLDEQEKDNDAERKRFSQYVG